MYYQVPANTNFTDPISITNSLTVMLTPEVYVNNPDLVCPSDLSGMTVLANETETLDLNFTATQVINTLC